MESTTTFDYKTLVSQKEDIDTAIPDCDNVYLIHCLETNYYKIGHSVDPYKRIGTFQTGCPFELRLLACCTGGSNFEDKLHEKYNEQRVRGEWFSFSDNQLADVIQIFIANRCEFNTSLASSHVNSEEETSSYKDTADSTDEDTATLTNSIEEDTSTDSLTALNDSLEAITLSPSDFITINKDNVTMFELKIPDTDSVKTLKELYGDCEIEYLLGFIMAHNTDITQFNIKWCPRTKAINYDEIIESYMSSKYVKYTSRTFGDFYEIFKLLSINCNNHEKTAKLVIAKCSHFKYSDPLFKLVLSKIDNIP